MEEVKCKACNHPFPLKESYCPKCGFELHIYPEPLSPELKKYEEDRINKYKEQRTKKEEELKEKEVAFNKVSTQLSDSRDTLKKNEEELKNAQTMARANEQRIVQLEKELADVQLKASKAKGEKSKAFLLIKENNDEAVCAIYEGRNSFGSLWGGVNNVNHQEINIEGLKPMHFCIEVINERYILYDLVGDILSATNKPISPKGVSLSNNSIFKIGNHIKVKLIMSI